MKNAEEAKECLIKALEHGMWFPEQSQLKPILKAMEQYTTIREKETAVQFKMDTSPLTPQIVDGEKKVREQTERLYNNWYTKHKEQ